MQLDAMPLTANGKVDKKALPEINKPEIRREIRQPENELQKTFCELFAKALGMEVGIDDDFFELGGTSLSAAKILMGAMVRNIPIEYQDIFDTKTVEKLEKKISGRMNSKAEISDKSEETTREEPSSSEKLLDHNRSEYVNEIVDNGIGNVLLTGATGFLGIHVLKELIEHSSCRITCLVKSKKSPKTYISPESRLRLQLFYYFDNAYEDLFGSRISVIDCDIADAEGIASLDSCDFDTVINCAAIVKHFADFNVLKKVNVDGVENLIHLCQKKKARLIHVSTVSISGEALKGRKTERTLTEDRLHIGQDTVSNAYVHTKYLAEEMIMNAVAEGLDAKIMRVSNLMSRQEDGEFQINFRTNSFMNSLRAYVALGCFPYSGMDEQVDFSPIDETAMCVVKLAGTPSVFNVFHVYNSHTVDMADVIAAMEHCGIHLEMVNDEEFAGRLSSGLANDEINAAISPLVNYDLTDDAVRKDIPCDNRFTIQALYRLGMRWSITDMDYLEKVIDMLSTLGFFDI